jgi:replication restart DNA helicase PriA
MDVSPEHFSLEVVADVVVMVPLSGRYHQRLFSYRVPDHLRETITVGQLVWVPLRQQQVRGVIIALQHRTADGLRDLIDLVDPMVSIPEVTIRLARWVAEYYDAPLATVLDLCLPPGTTRQIEMTWRATAAGLMCELGALPDRERSILFYLRRHGEQSEAALRAVLRGSNDQLRTAYRALAERGLIVRGTRIDPPRVQPRREQVVRMAVRDLEQALTELHRAPRQAMACAGWPSGWRMNRQRSVNFGGQQELTGREYGHSHDGDLLT